MKKIFITGGGGYVGTRLVQVLLKKNYFITVYDLFFYGNYLPKNKNLKVVYGDIRNTKKLEKYSKKHDFFLHLACISNDASYQLNEKLSKSINYDAFEPMVLSAKRNGIKRFIYASTSSVYGISNKKNVRENHPLKPLTFYNKYKGMCEPLLLKHTDEKFIGVVFRPATVCGYSPRMRFDLSVNILTNFAYNKGFIKIIGGKQLRPNLHILDYCDAVVKLLTANRKKVENKIFNVGYQNKSIENLAKIVQKKVEKFKNIKINFLKEKTNDKRSYHINSDKIKKELNFKPKRTIEMAINEICFALKNKKLPNSFGDDNYFNVVTLKKKKIK